MNNSDVTLFICVSCNGVAKGPDGAPEKPGLLLLAAVGSCLSGSPARELSVRPVECLSVCKRPCTVALAAKGKWTYVVGDLDHATDAGDVVAAALAFGASKDGIVPWRERPRSFRKGVVSRVPPLTCRPAGEGA